MSIAPSHSSVLNQSYNLELRRGGEPWVNRFVSSAGGNVITDLASDSGEKGHGED